MDNCANKGFVPLYHAGQTNNCPGCGRNHWIIGRATAECAFCETALQLAEVNAQPPAPKFWTRFSKSAERRREHAVGFAVA